MSGSVFVDEADRRASPTVVACTFALVAGVFSVFDGWWDTVADASVVVPVLNALAVAGAALAVFLLHSRERVVGDTRLGWVAAGIGIAGGSTLLQGLLIAELADFPLVATPSQAWRLEALAHVALIVFTIGAVVAPSRVRIRRWISLVFLALAASSLWCPASRLLPEVVDDLGRFTPVRGVILTILVVGTALALIAWIAACGRDATSPEVWIAILLSLVLADLVLGFRSASWIESVWWGTAPWAAAQFVIPAAGLLADQSRLLGVLQQHERRLQTQLHQQVTAVTAVARNFDLESEERIRRVLTEQTYRPVFQSIHAVETGVIVAVEALTRFTATPQRSPEQWFEEAWAVGLGTELELATFVTAFEASRSLPDEIAVSLNLSPSTLLDPRLLAYLDSFHHDRSLILELTEHAEVDDYPALLRVLQRVRKRGIRIAVDDAGAGFASLRHVVRLSPDIVKLDATLTRHIHRDPMKRALAASLADFAQQTQTMLVAEGVEHVAELAALRELGVQAAQGHLLGRPVEIDDLATLGDARVPIA